MPAIKPFDAWTYDTNVAGSWETLCCPPYDIVSEEEQRALEARNPYNCIRLERPLGGGREPYQRAAGLLDAWRRDGVLARAGAEAYFICEMNFRAGGKTYSLRGFTGRCELTPFSEGRVLPHEETLSKAKADRMELMLAAQCNFSPIYLLYSDPDGAIPGILAEAAAGKTPAADFTLGSGEFQVNHRMWRVDRPEIIARLSAAMADKRAFIADGHHRYETALAYRERVNPGGADKAHPANYVMASFFDMENPGLVVLPTHRVVYGCDPGAAAGLLDDPQWAAEPCDPGLIERVLAGNAGAILLYADQKAWRLTPRGGDTAMRRLLPDAGDAYRGLNVAALHAMILAPRFGIGERELAEQKHLIYTRDAAEATRMVDGGRGQCAFLLSPPTVSQIRGVSLEGGKMPQKSTYFYPKLITGLYINGLAE